MFSSLYSLFNPFRYLPKPTQIYNPLLYPTFEANRMAVRGWSQWNSLFLGWQQGPWNVWSSYYSAAQTINERLSRDYEKPDFKLGVDETKVLDKAFCSLLRFKNETDSELPKLLLIAPMSGHYASLLRDTVKALAPHHDLYVTDWKDAREVPLAEGSFGFEDYVSYLIEFLEFLGPNTHLVAVCQPTVPALVATSHLCKKQSPFRPKSLTLMGGPIDVAAAPTQVSRFAENRPLDWFRSQLIGKVPDRFTGAGRLVYPGFLQLGGFIAMNPGKHLRSHVKLFHDLAQGEQEKADKTSRFYDDYFAVCDLPARFYLETVERVFQKRQLANGTMTYKGELVEPSAITDVPLLTIEGEKDDISAPGQTLAAHTLCDGLPEELRHNHLQKDAGHYGVFSGSKWREKIAPRLTQFIRDCDSN